MKKFFLTVCQRVFVHLGNTKDLVYYWASNDAEICDLNWDIGIAWFWCLFVLWSSADLHVFLFENIWCYLLFYGSFGLVNFLDILQLFFRYFRGAANQLAFCFLSTLAKCSMKHRGTFIVCLAQFWGWCGMKWVVKRRMV